MCIICVSCVHHVSIICASCNSKRVKHLSLLGTSIKDEEFTFPLCVPPPPDLRRSEEMLLQFISKVKMVAFTVSLQKIKVELR